MAETTKQTPKKNERKRLMEELQQRLNGLGISAAAITHTAQHELAALSTEERNQAIAEQASELLRTQAGLALLLNRMPEGGDIDRTFWALAGLVYQESREK